jgi:hypothetical protein
MSEAAEFAAKMYKMEYALELSNVFEWGKFESESGDFWLELGAEGWQEAFIKDTMGCVAYKEKLENLLK